MNDMSERTPQYQAGFGNHFSSEALPGALPVGRNSPQRCAYGLVAEQFTGTAFTAPRQSNRRSWLYRIHPAAAHRPFAAVNTGTLAMEFGSAPTLPNALRWSPLPVDTLPPTDFIDGLLAWAGNGSPERHDGCAVYLYAANRSMHERFFCNADGELLIVPQQGRLSIATELGRLSIEPQQMAVIPRGLRFKVELPDVGSTPARGYVCENYGAPFRLPELGPIGSNGLANPRDFETPTADYEHIDGRFELVTKFLGQRFSAEIDHSPLDVVAWHGNHVPYRYDLRRFNTIGSISFDHPDPSIFTVLQSPSDTVGTSNIDFVVFPPRWLVAEDTFRPPWFHRNVASEFMGLVHGQYDAKADGFLPGGASLHNCMTGHGPDAATVERAAMADTRTPHYVADTMAFMFETRHVLRPTARALASPQWQADYWTCWQNIGKRFDPNRREPI